MRGLRGRRISALASGCIVRMATVLNTVGPPKLRNVEVPKMEKFV